MYLLILFNVRCFSACSIVFSSTCTLLRFRTLFSSSEPRLCNSLFFICFFSRCVVFQRVRQSFLSCTTPHSHSLRCSVHQNLGDVTRYSLLFLFKVRCFSACSTVFSSTYNPSQSRLTLFSSPEPRRCTSLFFICFFSRCVVFQHVRQSFLPRTTPCVYARC